MWWAADDRVTEVQPQRSASKPARGSVTSSCPDGSHAGSRVSSLPGRASETFSVLPTAPEKLDLLRQEEAATREQLEAAQFACEAAVRRANQLADELHVSQQQLANAEQRSGELAVQVEARDREVAALTSRAEAHSFQAAQWNDALRALRAQHTDALDRVQQLEVRHRELEIELQRSQEQGAAACEQLQGEIARLGQHVERGNLAANQAASDLAAARLERDDVARQLQQMREQSAVERELLQQQIGRERGAAERTASELAAALRENEGLANALQCAREEWSAERDRLRGELEGEVSAAVRLSTELTTALRENELLSASRSAAAEQLAAALARSEAEACRAEDLSQQLSATSAELHCLRERSAAEVTLLGQLVEREKLAADQARMDLAGARADYDDVARQLQQTRDQLAAERAQFLQQVAREQDAAAKAASELAVAHRENEGLASTLRRLNEESSAQREHLRDELDREVTAAARLSTELTAALRENELLSVSRSATAEQLATALATGEAEACRAEQLSQQLLAASAELHCVREQFAAECNQLQQQIGRERGAAERTASELAAALRENEGLANALQHAREEWSAERERLCGKLEGEVSAAARLSTELTAALRENELLSVSRSATAEQLAAALARGEAEACRAEDLSQQLSATSVELHCLRERSAAEVTLLGQLVEREKLAADQARMDLAGARADYDDLARQLQQTRDQLAAERAQFLQQVAREQDAAAKAASELAVAHREKEGLASTLRHLNEESSAQREHLRDELEREVTAAARLSTELAAARRENELLTESRSAAAEQLAAALARGEAEARRAEQLSQERLAATAQRNELAEELRQSRVQHAAEYTRWRSPSMSPLPLEGQQEIQRLLQRLQLEAAARRKAEAALRHAAAQPDSEPGLRDALSHIESAQLVERLRRELTSVRNFQGLLLYRAEKRIFQLQAEVERLRSHVPPQPRKATRGQSAA